MPGLFSGSSERQGMKAAVFERFGDPVEVLSVRDVPLPEPGPGQVRVRMIASPINPSDLLVVRGRYGVLPRLPATPGFEGVGIVDKAGPGLLGRWVEGKRVAAINSVGGNWAEYAVIPARQARPIPADIADEQAATFFVNPATVLAMVRHVLEVPKGEWLLQSAAGSTLGKMIIKLGRHDGFKTVNVVRRSEAKEELTRLGADAVINSSEGPIDEQVKRITGGDGVRYALDPIGGEAGTGVFRSLAPEGRLVIYGTLSGEPIQIDPRHLISGRKVVEGFWLGHWMRDRSIPSALLLFREIASLIRQGVLSSHIGQSFDLDEIREAVRQADTIARGGKVLLKLLPEDTSTASKGA
jgi:NADPH:quinone reductase